MDDIDLDKLDTMTPEEIENIRVEKLKALEVCQNHCAIIEQKFFDIQLKIISLQKEKKELEITLSKAKQMIRQLKTQCDVLRSKFWNNKNK